MNAARREQMLFGARCDVTSACTFQDKYGVAHGLSPAETIEQLQNIHANMARNTGFTFADRLLALICEFEEELTEPHPEIEAFKTLGPATLDRRIERVE